MGYCKNSKVYRLYNPSSRKIIKSRDIYFNNKDKPKDIEAQSKEDSVVVSLKEENIFKDTREKDISQEDIEEISLKEDQEIKISTEQLLRKSTRITRPP